MIKKLLCSLLLLTLVSCGGNDKKNVTASDDVKVTPHTLNNQLFFSGTILPIKTMVVMSPVDGVIDDMTFYYGDVVKANQPLFKISSEKFKSDYKTALMTYIKAKNDFTTAQSQFTEGKFLFKNQLISDDDFKSKQSAFYNAQLSLIQAQDALTLLLKQLSVPGVSLKQLTIDNITKITQALHIDDRAEQIQVVSPVAGVALLPLKTGSDDDKKMSKGQSIKQGDVLAVIGDVSGFMIHVEVNEFNINQLQVGQKVKVTGPAFPDFVLNGHIAGLDRQGQTSQSGLPVFPVDVVVPTITPEQQKLIHIGMSAKVEIDIESAKQITVPINAVYMKNNATFVKVKTMQGDIKEVPVKTGTTTASEVVITSTLDAGDEVVVPH